MLKRVKEAMRSRYMKLMVVATLALSCMAVPMFAVEPEAGAIDTAAITTAFTSGFQNIVTTSVGLLSAMLPIAISLCSVLFIVKKAMKWFKSVSNG